MLATPNLGGVFESRPGIKIRGEKKVLSHVTPKPEEKDESEEEQVVYNISDIEEEEGKFRVIHKIFANLEFTLH